MPVYATEDSNGRHRMLKHMHCLATIHGALAPPNTGVLAIQTSTSNQQVTTAPSVHIHLVCDGGGPGAGGAGRG